MRKTQVLKLGVVALLLVTQVFIARATAQAPAPAKYSFLAGEWEAVTSGNRWRMWVDWDGGKQQFRGVLTKQGEASANVGFKMGEHVWTGIPVGDPDVVVTLQKYRTGANGVSSGASWESGNLNLEKSSSDDLVNFDIEFRRIR